MIIEQTQYTDTTQFPGGLPPDHFASETQKSKPSYIKGFVDYYASIAKIYYNAHSKKIKKNYDLLKGILTPEDYYQDPETSSFIQTLKKNIELPKHIVHYSILGTPINTLVGEQSRRPDQARVKAQDEDSKNEELEYRNAVTLKAITEMIQRSLQTNAELSGQQLSPEEFQAKLEEELGKELSSYTTKAERWGSKVLNSCKVEFNMKEQSEEGIRNLCTSAQEYFHVFEDSSKTGFSVIGENPRDIWQLIPDGVKYTSDLAGTNRGAYAIGTIKLRELSEIMDRLSLSKEDIDHLRKQQKESFSSSGVSRSNYGSSQTGINTVKYDTYNPLIEQERMFAEADVLSGDPGLNGLLGLSPSINTFGNKFLVTEGYVVSKKKIGQLTFINKFGDLETMTIDESYEKIPNEVEVEWGYVNQWYKFYQIGTEVYNLEPFNLLPYCPIIGVRHEVMNTQAVSLVDLMKPFQILYNVCMNQLFTLLGKEIGVVYNVTLRKIPRSKEGDGKDDIDLWEEEARDRGIIFESDSPEDLKIAGNTNPARAVDLSRSQEMQTRYNLAVTLKNECWELVGISRQRAGSVQATETATATNTALTQSYAQTEPIFAQHEYLMNQVYQAIVDAAQYIETKKEVSTLSYLNSEGDNEFIRMLPEDLRMRDLKVFVTSRAEDQRIAQKMEGLAEAMLQNGVSAYEVSVIYSTASLRAKQEILRRMKERQDSLIDQQNKMQQEQIKQQREAVQAQIQAAQQQHILDLQHESQENELERQARSADVKYQADARLQSMDRDRDGIPDVLEEGKIQVQRDKVYLEAQAKQQQMLLDAQQQLQDQNVKREIAQGNNRTAIQIAKMKPKPTK